MFGLVYIVASAPNKDNCCDCKQQTLYFLNDFFFFFFVFLLKKITLLKTFVFGLAVQKYQLQARHLTR